VSASARKDDILSLLVIGKSVQKPRQRTPKLLTGTLTSSDCYAGFKLKTLLDGAPVAKHSKSDNVGVMISCAGWHMYRGSVL
jgi:hypothetical protein